MKTPSEEAAAPGAGTLTGFIAESGAPCLIRYEDGLITAIEGVASAPPVWISPGFIDLQVNGFGGHDFNGPDRAQDEVGGAVRALWSHGVTTVCPTICTEAEEHILCCLRTIADARDGNPLVAHAIPAIHVEGPHISAEDGPRGVHPRALVRPPAVDEYRRWQVAARGLVGVVTVAPELPGAIDYIRSLVEDGVIVAIGHTAAGEAEIRAAVEAGARLSTHLGNGAHTTIRRHPNYIWEQLAEDRLWASLILDGRHLPRSVIRTFLRAKGVERIAAVSDAVTFAGMAPGVYEGFGTQLELRDDGTLVMAGTPYLAGSTSALDTAVAVAVRDGGLGVRDAVRLVTTNPASLLAGRLEPGRGSLTVGAPADLVAFRIDPAGGEVTVELTVVEGREVFHRDRARPGPRPRAPALGERSGA